MGIRAGLGGVSGLQNQSTAQVIDGSLKFNHSIETHLVRTPSSAGNRRTFTWSCWVKLSGEDRNQTIFFAGPNGDDTYPLLWDSTNNNFEVSHYQGGYTYRLSPSAVHRDTGWYHVVVAFDTTQSTSSDRIKFYVNGEQITDFDTETYPSQNYDNSINEAYANHRIGFQVTANAFEFNGSLSQCYFIDGQQLDASYFGFTDPLTNTWKPKKYTGTYGTNGFYLPMDGNSPIGQDKSGNGNDWTPVNFGGSVALDKATGAIPILNTTQGGTQAGVGVFGSRENVGYAVTVYDDGGGNKYYIDGVEAPTLSNLIRGATYTFDQSDSSNSTHPLVFGSTAEGNNFARGANYGSVSAGSAGAATTITIPYDAPETLYYHCSAHSGMGGSIVGIHTDETKADQYASNCTFAVPLVGANSDVSASIACTTTNKSVTSNGSAVASNLQSNFYNGSFYFDGTGDYLSIAQSSDFQFASSAIDFTIEAYVYGSAFSGAFTTVVSVWGGGTGEGQWLLSVSTSGVLGFAWGPYSIGGNFISGGTLSTNTWHHVAVTRSGNTFRLFVDGAETASGTNSGTNSNNAQLSIGRYGIGYSAYDSSEWEGYIQDVRIYKGVAKYTSDFVVPSINPDILPDSPSGVSGSSKLTKITDGAVAFDGTGDYLSIADSEDLEFGSGDFTIEAYIYPTGIPQGTYATIFAKGAPLQCYFMNTNSLSLFVDSNNDGTPYDIISNTNITGTDSVGQYRWSHFAICRNGNNWKVFVNGVQKYSATHSGTIFNNTSAFSIGDISTSPGTYEFQGFISNFRVVKGTALYTSNFIPSSVPLTNVTNTKLLCCQSNTSATEADVTPGTITANGDAAPTNFNPFITDINTVRGEESGYCTANPLDKGALDLSDGNLRVERTSDTADWETGRCTIKIPDTGRWYWEMTLSAGSNDGIYTGVGVGTAVLSQEITGFWAYNSAGYAIYNTSYASSLSSMSVGDTACVSFDRDNNKMWVLLNGADSIYDGNPYSGTDPNSNWTNIPSDVYPVVGARSTGVGDYNFGQKPFKFSPPDGFQPLNTANVRPETVISRPDQYVGVTTYTGNGSTQTISGLNHKPDLVWLKARTTGGGSFTNHVMVDSVRGKNDYGYRNLYPNLSNAEYDPPDVSSSSVTSLNANRFDIGGNANTNHNTATYVAWCWKAGGNKNTFNVDNVGYSTHTNAPGLSDGTITPTGASVGTKQGFSIIKYDGTGSNATVPHGLNQKPNFIIIKRTSNTASWQVYSSEIGATKYLRLNSTAAEAASSIYHNDTEPTSSVFTVGTSAGVNGNGDSYISYIWHDVPGLQKFGRYEGNGSTDGTFVELGFRPALLIVKNVDATGLWLIADKERNKFNPIDSYLQAEDSADEYGPLNGDAAYTWVDFLSNGFKLRQTGGSLNTSSADYIYMAWAEAPTFDLYGGGANAR